MQTAFEETQDAIDVLTAPDAQGIFPSAVPHLTTAQARISQAQLNTNPAQRRQLVQQAINSLVAARAEVGSGSLASSVRTLSAFSVHPGVVRTFRSAVPWQA